MNQEINVLLSKYEERIIGQSTNLRLLLSAVLAGGHVLVEGVPGTGKTQMVKTLARLIGGGFNRIQFTPDLLPSDITGSTIYNMKESSFQTLKGPIFTNILLADEINRTPAKTQAALLEAMEEKQVTIQGKTYTLEEVFFVVATQNPLEFEGTYPLPEAQQDRFLFKLDIDFPAFAEEKQVLAQVIAGIRTESDAPVMDLATFLSIRNEIEGVTINDAVLDYIMQIVRRTRETESIRFGASTRAAISIARAARAWAYLQERDYVTPDDVKIVAKPALRHRIQLSPHVELEGLTVDQIIQELVGSVTVPR
ncbi:MoxR family ATPase [Rossellomorea marisflavi]|jgi:MoxR-like ATPase|uniref:MoxR family ATPase n=1 Tax=Rossellomorea marisflavi TaxID=189381 RepID=A0A5D4RIC3_9BACI|nr:MoxR family ATPase [Rossellomorea marisflavi]KQU62998.1 magnesium chelatase [Bacillus sp. Leaf406]MDW4525116.1 MoxR family ATPase [Rossellomorea marisflavi]TYS50630.1 MoxR family ATPase [Rossellomorea marisflavi]UKS65843.1 MoxR family ATPase [Rossellomorea marisflavi]WJV18431.1 MoxR family ATPase [Rossellomorea marisflavi]